MEATQEDVTRLIKEGFPGADISGIQVSEGKIFGEFRWPKFQGMGVEDRLRLVSEKVRGPLGLDGMNVGIIVPLAPREKAF